MKERITANVLQQIDGTEIVHLPILTIDDEITTIEGVSRYKTRGQALEIAESYIPKAKVALIKKDKKK